MVLIKCDISTAINDLLGAIDPSFIFVFIHCFDCDLWHRLHDVRVAEPFVLWLSYDQIWYRIQWDIQSYRFLFSLHIQQKQHIQSTTSKIYFSIFSENQ